MKQTQSKIGSGSPLDYFHSIQVMDQDGCYRCDICDAWLDEHGDYGSYSYIEVAAHHLKTEHKIVVGEVKN